MAQLMRQRITSRELVRNQRITEHRRTTGWSRVSRGRAPLVMGGEQVRKRNHMETVTAKHKKINQLMTNC